MFWGERVRRFKKSPKFKVYTTDFITENLQT